MNRYIENWQNRKSAILIVIRANQLFIYTFRALLLKKATASLRPTARSF